VPHEIVRIATATEGARDVFDEPFDAATVVGQEAVVEGAMPHGDGWVIHAWVESLDDVYDFPEDALESTGRVSVQGEGSTRDRQLDPDQDRWRDDVLVEAATDTTDPALAAAIAKDAAGTLATIQGVDEVDWRLEQWTDEPHHITLWAWSYGDALQAFGRIVSLVESGWEHDDDEEVFVTSRWKQSDDRAFLARGIRELEVSYRRWTSPVRRSRSEIGAISR